MKRSFLVILLTLISNLALPQNLPNAYGNVLIQHTYYSVGLDPQNKIASWVMHTLTPTMASELDSDVTREDVFRTDPLLEKELQGSDSDYKGSGYDRGHLCPAEDMDFNASAMIECFYYTNIAPQNPTLNRGLWRKIETKSRVWALSDTIFVITGTISDPNSKSIGKGITVPNYFYKIIVNKDLSESISFLVPNSKPIYDIKNYLTNIDKIEEISRIDFFHDIEEVKENHLEGKISLDYFKMD